MVRPIRARELLKLGHDVRIMPAAYVKPYVRRQKNDAADAAGICEAVTRPSMRFVGVRTLENQAALMHHKSSHAHNHCDINGLVKSTGPADP